MTRMERIAGMPCICCVQEWIGQPFRTEVHHLVDKGYRKHSGGDEATIPLCSWHHRGVCEDGKTGSQMAFIYGPSLALNKRLFVKTYGTERELLALVNSGDYHEEIF